MTIIDLVFDTSISNSSYRIKGGSSDTCCDWGKTIDDNGTWRVLTKAEWYYLLFTRTVNGGEGKGYSWVDATIDGVPGVIIFYDSYSGATSDNLTEIPDGCAFLSGAGYRVGTSLDTGNLNIGFYWASTSSGYDGGNDVAFYNIVNMQYGDSRQRGQSLRLVADYK